MARSAPMSSLQWWTGAVEAHRDPGMGTDHAHVQAGIADVVADVLDTHQREKERVVADDRHVTGRGEPRCGTDHVALGDAEVEIAVGMLAAEADHLRRSPEIGGADDDVVAFVDQLAQHGTGGQLRRQPERGGHVPGGIVGELADAALAQIDRRLHLGADVADAAARGCGIIGDRSALIRRSLRAPRGRRAPGPSGRGSRGAIASRVP